MQLRDFSDLRRTETIEIPLNGEIYEAVADPEAELVLEATGLTSSGDLELLVKAMEQQQKGEGTLSPAEMAKAGAVGGSRTQRILRFLDQVLTEESAERWRANMRPADPSWSKTKKAEHEKRKITLVQTIAVANELIQVYSAGRPTTPSASSPNGSAGGGRTSTAGARAGG